MAKYVCSVIKCNVNYITKSSTLINIYEKCQSIIIYKFNNTINLIKHNKFNDYVNIILYFRTI